MRAAVTVALVLGALGAGVGVGVLLGDAQLVGSRVEVRTEAAAPSPSASGRAWEADDGPLGRRAFVDPPRRVDPREHDDVDDEDRRSEPNGRAGASGSSEPAAPLDDLEALAREVVALRRENRELRDEHVELLGEPLPQPTDVEPRFAGPTLSGSVVQAIGQAGVDGKVEHVDCSEYPCITFGRLAGDEEDMEEIERAAALSPYDADVLTLLFWATTVDSADAAGPRETGLFALAFYTQDDRASDGAALDRRIRARTVEYWNTDRPARPPAAGLD